MSERTEMSEKAYTESVRLYFKARPFFKPKDFWIGVYVDRENRAVYICPLPMFGLKVWWWRETSKEADYRRGAREVTDFIKECIKLGRTPEDAIQSAEYIFKD